MRLDPEIQAILKSKVWEDNARALILVKLEHPRMTLRFKHYALKYHWFRYEVKELCIGLNKIGTKEQLADIVTQGLPGGGVKAYNDTDGMVDILTCSIESARIE